MSLTEEKEKKYDRQLRLWGKDGQIALENCKVCLIGAGPAATETMKNLVLPGIGSFTVIDNKVLTETDLHNNFFVEESHLGQSRAEVVKDLLSELNPDVLSSDFVNKDPVDLIENELDYFKRFSLVVASDLSIGPLLKLAKYCYEQSIPLFVVKCYGFIGYLRICTPLHTIVESKPDFPSYDLRLSAPFEALEQYAISYDFDSLNSREHSHIPFPVILIQSINKWKNDHDGKIPTTSAEKDEFKKSVLRLSKKSAEENFEEAYQNALHAFRPYSIPSTVSEVLYHDKATQLNEDSDNFWILASAVRKFVENEGDGKLPLMGSIPDLVSETATFIELQKIYSKKALEDRTIVEKHMTDILKSLGRPEDSIPSEYIEHFCKNILFLRALVYRSLEEEYNPETSMKENFWQISDLTFNMHWYFLLRAAENYNEKYGQYPGSDLSSTERDEELEKYKQEVHSILTTHELEIESISNDYIQEFFRYGNSQLHNIGAIIGGVAAQEIIKVITHQWVPLNNTYIFNGLDSNSMVLEM